MFLIGKKNKGKTVIEYLPDADEIERSPLPRAAQLTMHVLLLAFVLFGVWAAISSVDQVVVAPGRLVNPVPNVVVQPLETSIIQSVEVRQGQTVKKGTVLATMDATFVQADEDQVRSRLQSLQTQIDGLEREIGGGLPSPWSKTLCKQNSCKSAERITKPRWPSSVTARPVCALRWPPITKTNSVWLRA